MEYNKLINLNKKEEVISERIEENDIIPISTLINRLNTLKSLSGATHIELIYNERGNIEIYPYKAEGNEKEEHNKRINKEIEKLQAMLIE